MSAVDRFRALHSSTELFVMPNPWDRGSAKLLADLGFSALATTSSGSAAALGLSDGALDRQMTLRLAADLADAVDVPVSADLENCFADEPAGVAQTISQVLDTGLAGASIEDWSGERIYDKQLAVARVQAAVETAAGRLVVTARAENLIRGIDDLDDTIGRLQAFAEAGADVVFAPGLRGAEQIAAVVQSVDVPVSVLIGPSVPPVQELAELGVRRVSTGGKFAFAAYAALVDAGRELMDAGTYGFSDGATRGLAATDSAFGTG